MTVIVFGTNDCPDTQHAREWLDQHGQRYAFTDLQRDEPARDWVKEHNGGKEIKPTIQVGDAVLSNPSDEELQAALQHATETA